MLRQTSISAYQELIPRTVAARNKIISLLKRSNMTDGEICQHFSDHEIKTIQPRARRNELVKMGLIKEIGKRPCLTNGKMCHFWGVV